MRRMVSVLSTLVGLGAARVRVPHDARRARPAASGCCGLNVNSTDIKYLDPALNYDFYGWRLEAATCAMLLGYPDKAGPASARLYPEVATRLPEDHGRRKDVHVHA